MKKKIKLVNICINGDFSNGSFGWLGFEYPSTRWYLQPGKAKYLDSYNSAIIQNTLFENVDINSKYYIKATITTEIEGLNSLSMFNIGDADLTYSYKPQSEYSNILTPINTNILQIGGRTSGSVFFVSYIVVVNLTKSFGLGNEPTKEQMDAIMDRFPNKFFNGTVYI